MNENRYLHLVFWAFFGFAAALVWFVATTPGQSVFGLLTVAALVVASLGGIYSTWDAMTAYEQ